MTREAKSNFLISTLFYLVVAAIIYIIAKFLFVYLLPFIIGTIITVIVQRPAGYVSKRFGFKKGNCALFFVIVIYIVVIALLFMAVLKIGTFVSDVAANNSGIFNRIGNIFNEMLLMLKDVEHKIPAFLGEQISNVFNGLIKGITGYISNFAKNTAKAAPMFLTTSVVTVIASCYIAKDFDRFVYSIKSVLSQRYKYAISELRLLLKDNVSKLLIGYIKLLLITFVELAIGLYLLRVKNSLIVAAVIALLDLLPILGTGTILIPWGVYNLFVANYYLGAGLLIMYAIILLIRNIIEPKIVGKQIGLHPLIALISVFIGLKLFGFLGILLAPLTVMLIYKIYERGIFDILFSKN